MRLLVLVASCVLAGGAIGVLAMAWFVAGSDADDQSDALERELLNREQAEHVQRFSLALGGELIRRPARRVGTPNRAESPRSLLSAPNTERWAG